MAEELGLLPTQSNSTSRSAMDSYQLWNSWLLERSFPAGRPGSAVYLEVYESLLDEGAEEIGLLGPGSELFTEAILALGQGNSEDVFPKLAELASTWRSDSREEEPPFVAGLGFAVLAASEMRTDPGKRVTAANYYYRLNQLLGLSRKGQPPGFESTREMWKDLRDWLSANRRGALVLRGLDSVRKYVDPVKSQCLVRTCDLDEFSALLRRIQCVPGREVDPEDVAPFLSRWLRCQGATSRLARILGRDPTSEMLHLAAEALADRIELWGYDSGGGGETKSVVPRATLQAEPHHHPSLRWKGARWSVAIFADAATDHESVTLSIADETFEAELDYFEPPRFVCPVGLKSVAEILKGSAGIVVSGAEAEIPFDTPLWIEVPPGSSRRDTWEPTNSLSAGLEYQVVFREREFDLLARKYGSMFEEGYEILEGADDAWPGPGLFALCSARIARGDDLPDSIGFSPIRERLRLSGGLKVARSTYLFRALPEVEARRKGSLKIINEVGEIVAEFGGQNLNELDLNEGKYTVRREMATATFAVTSPRWGEVRIPEGRHTTSDWQSCLGDGHSRGALVRDVPSVHLLHLEPGKKFTAYAPECQKINVPADGGVFEFRYSGEFGFVMRGSQRAKPPLPLHQVFTVKWASDGSVVDRKAQELADRLLLFISARGSGPVERLRAPCQDLAEDGEPWHRVLLLYEALGHVDVDWDARRWFAAPPVLCQRSSCPDSYFAAGVRTLDYRDRLRGVLQEWPDPHQEVRHVAPQVQLYAGPREVIAHTCQASDIHLPGEPPAEQLLMHLRPVAEMDWWLGPAFCPPRDPDRFELWEPFGMTWSPAKPELLLERVPGSRHLVRWKDVGLTRMVLVEDAESRLVRDPSAAKWHLAPEEVALTRYLSKERAMEVPRAMGLPRPYLRASILASGLPPRTVHSLEVYDYFSLRMARLLAVRLRQTRSQGLW